MMMKYHNTHFIRTDDESERELSQQEKAPKVRFYLTSCDTGRYLDSRGAVTWTDQDVDILLARGVWVIDKVSVIKKFYDAAIQGG